VRAVTAQVAQVHRQCETERPTQALARRELDVAFGFKVRLWGQVGFEPQKVSTALKRAFYIVF